MTHEAGKGDKQRPTNKEAFDKHFDNIFRKRAEPYQIKCERCDKEVWVDPEDIYSDTHYCNPKEKKNDDVDTKNS